MQKWKKKYDGNKIPDEFLQLQIQLLYVILFLGCLLAVLKM